MVCLQCLVRGRLRNLNGFVQWLNHRIGFSRHFLKNQFQLYFLEIGSRDPQRVHSKNLLIAPKCKSFAKEMLTYLNSQWINGHIEPELLQASVYIGGVLYIVQLNSFLILSFYPGPYPLFPFSFLFLFETLSNDLNHSSRRP